MSWSDEVDRAFAKRREELLHEITQDTSRIVGDVGTVVGAFASQHLLAYLGTGAAAGACATWAVGRRKKSPRKPLAPKQPVQNSGQNPGRNSAQSSGMLHLVAEVVRLVPTLLLRA